MYGKINVCIQSGQKVSPFFASTIGVRQGDNLSPTLFNLFLHDLPAKLGLNCSPANYGDLVLSNLLYADDLVLFSETEAGLQSIIKRLQEYATLWALKVNLSKTKTLYIGPKRLSNARITCQFGDKPIDEVDTYSYLGILLSNDSSSKTVKRDIYNKGLKAYFKLTRAFKPQPKVSTMTHLFDHLIKPILLYGAEVYGHTTLKNCEPKESDNPRTLFFQQIKKQCPIVSSFMNADDPIEKLHLRFCRRVLQVHSKTVNLGVYGELGRAPLFIDKVICTMKYFYHMKFSSENKILKLFFSNAEKMQSNSFITFADMLHKQAGLCPPQSIKEANRNICLLKKKLHREFQFYWRELVTTDFSKSSKSGNNKLRSYRKYKTAFKSEKYLDLADSGLRKGLAQLRLSSHKLKIECGRYNAHNCYIPPAERICGNCNLNEPEDENHFLLRCAAYDSLRTGLFIEASSSNPFFPSYNDEQKFVWLMSNENPSGIKCLAKFVREAMGVRKS